MTPETAFWIAFGLGLYGIRVMADYVRLRLHIRGVHVHHFVWGCALTPATWILFYYDLLWLAMPLAGIVAALVASETKEVILQKWGP